MRSEGYSSRFLLHLSLACIMLDYETLYVYIIIHEYCGGIPVSEYDKQQERRGRATALCAVHVCGGMF